jgi:hypothetical protein
MAEGHRNGPSMISHEVGARSIDIGGIDNSMEKHNEPVRAPCQGTFLFARCIPGRRSLRIQHAGSNAQYVPSNSFGEWL